MFSGNGLSLADIAAVTGNRNSDDGFGGGNGWWVLIILFAIFGGWGNGNGWGGNSGGNGGVGAEVQRGFDTQSIISKLDGINNGICSLGYDQLAQMNNISNTVMQTGFGINTAMNQGFNALAAQLAECCCENRAAIAQVRYDMANDTCAIKTAIEGVNRTIVDQFCQLKMEQKDATIAQQQSMINALNLAQSQANQNAYFDQRIAALQESLSPCPKPAYWVQNPNCCQTPWGPFGFNGSWGGFNNGGCGNGCCGG